MKDYIIKDEWNIIEEGFDPALNKISESLFSLGNGRMGQRGNFEEKYSGETLQGNYIAGVYYPDKTRVGWWKNGYPEYFAKVLNAANWIGIDVAVEGETLDLHTSAVKDFKRVLNMKEGYLQRSFVATLQSGKQIAVEATRFCSIINDEAGVIKYAVTPLNFNGTITFKPFIDGDIANQDSNYDEKFWDEVNKEVLADSAYVTLRTKKTAFEVCTGSKFAVVQNGNSINVQVHQISKEKFVGHSFDVAVKANEETVLYKYAANVSSQNYAKEKLVDRCKEVVEDVFAHGFDKMLAQQKEAWAYKWSESDIVIEGDVAAQQAIRFNIFQLNQTYTGEDARLNIGPKGFTGEKYGGSTYWDTEAYCVPFYLSTADAQVARNLLYYRYQQLGKAIENAEKLGFTNGAALFPMVTINGEECHNEWEITFEEIHRNGAIVYAIYNYTRYTGDTTYIKDYGLEVLIGIARFWAQRVNWSTDKLQYVMLGVTGPNEYENNINNNWYTNYLASWCLQYAIESIDTVKSADASHFNNLAKRLQFNESAEKEKWSHIIDHMYYPEDKRLGIYLQQDGYMDKEQVLVRDIPASQRPINQKWSWDRILRSCFIKQADVLQGIYFFEEKFDEEAIRRNFDFYEARTVHESSLSPCVHAILAAKLGYEEKAYEMYLRTSRLDLDDYNNDTEDGLHITSMAGTWMSVVQGFAGMRVYDGKLHFNPFIPGKWKSFSFNINFRGAVLSVEIKKEYVRIINRSGVEVSIVVLKNEYVLKGNDTVEIQVREEEVIRN
ncbi:glycoside hydrolase family 65 protein [Pinibacter aurantiacus]|uniref:Glycoside hydrolase family 65 protein n=1 Tax=Pinibacter aurantiacus TaxID=2851599 RepID=A0A9E2SBI1_9BACT|nr:glycoside hydrolase family 65 protein [Pinibacter aurantiacus]MBV4358404.1 glycoside hydrolase family 65 protein [Pinibacter aurantiacus]